MINETVMVLARLEDLSGHRLAKYIAGNLELNAKLDLFYHQPLQKIFSGVIAYDFTKRITEIGVQGVNDEVIALVKKEHPKYVLWLSAMYEFQEATFEVIRQEGSIVVGWFGDDEYRFAHYSRWFVPYLDYCVTFDLEALPRYQALGARIFYEISCEGVPVNIDWSNVEEKHEVSFVGWKSKALRAQYINVIRQRNIPLSLFGRGWEAGYIPYEDMINVFKTSKINLNFSGTGNRKGLKARVPLVCLSGGFLLTEYVPGIENFFEIDKEIVCFKNAEEMVEKITYYLSHAEERRAIARAGWKRATNEYSPYHMLSRVFEKIEKDLADQVVKSHVQKMKIPLWIRSSPSHYYFQWGRAFLEEGYDNLWKDALSLSLSYNPFNIGARYYYIIGHLPVFMRPLLFKLYLPYNALERFFAWFGFRLFGWFDSVPYLKDIKRSISKKLSYS